MRLKIAFLVEVGEGFVDASQDFVGGLGDEGGGRGGVIGNW
jgi:hypothetical protein